MIKLSALGDFIQACGPFAAIREHHRQDRVTLLTTRPFAALAEASPWFDEVWVDTRPKAWDVVGVLKLRKLLRRRKFDMVYDLQTSDRSSGYFHVMGGPPWSGIAAGCSHPHDNPGRDSMHSIERQAEQLAMAGIPTVPPADLSWLTADLAGFDLPQRFVLMIPGGAPHRPGKRWPAERFAALARRLAADGIASLLLGTAADGPALDAIAAACPAARALTDRTGFAEIAALARRAVAAVGNDTGPMHLVTAVGCPAVVLFSAASDPDLCAPRGRVTLLRRDDLAQLGEDEVEAALRRLA